MRSLGAPKMNVVGNMNLQRAREFMYKDVQNDQCACISKQACPERPNTQEKRQLFIGLTDT